MKINRMNIQPVNPYRANDMKMQKADQTSKLQEDKLEISSEAKKLSEIQSYTVNRNERISELKSEIQAGTYNVDPKKIAVDLLGYYNK